MLLLAILLAVFVLEEPWSWIVLVAGVTLELAETGLFVWWSKRRRSVVGAEALVGRTAVVAVDCMPDGQVRVAGELWRATCRGGAAAGDEVVVTAVQGLELEVEPA